MKKKLLSFLTFTFILSLMLSSYPTIYASTDEGGEIYLKTKPIPIEVDKYTADIFNHFSNQDFLMSGCGTKNDVSVGNAFTITSYNRKNHSDLAVYYYPIIDGDNVSGMLVMHGEKGDAELSYQLGQDPVGEAMGKLKPNAPSNPYEIIITDNAVYALNSDSVIFMYEIIPAWWSMEMISTEKINAEMKELARYKSSDEDFDVICIGSDFLVENDDSGSFLKIDGNYYYSDHDGSSGKNWINFKGSNYFIDANGKALTKNTTINGKLCKFNSDGKYEGLYTGWTKKGGEKYYYLGGVRQTGLVKISGIVYRFEDNGKLVGKYSGRAKEGSQYSYYRNGILDVL